MSRSLLEVAEQIAQCIDHENGVIHSADWEQEQLGDSQGEGRWRQRQLFRDKKRAESKIMAFKESLNIIFQAIGVSSDAEEYMSRRAAPKTM